MKTVILNGSPRVDGNCNLVAERFAESLDQEGIMSEILQIGAADIKGCRGCGGCAKDYSCVFHGDGFHELADKVYEAEGLLIVAPVYFDSMPGQLKTFLDRLFFQDRSGGGLRNKVASACAVPRRTGGVATLDDLYHYMTDAGMLIAPSVGSNMVYGFEKGESARDVEGLDIMRKLARNMAWVMKMIDMTKDELTPPGFVEREYMHFIR